MTSYDDGKSRLQEARNVASATLDELELGSSSIGAILMKARRLARLLRDADAEAWLELELRGYPTGFSFSGLGTCYKYAIKGGRVTTEDKYWPISLPELESKIKALEAQLENLRFPSTYSPSSSNPMEVVGSWSGHFLKNFTTTQHSIANNLSNSVRIFAGLKSALHSYVADCHMALTLGRVAEDIFSEARVDVDRFVRAHCPGAAEQLIAAHERLGEGDAEAFAHAMVSCRRVLRTVADAVFPSRGDPHVDIKGRDREIGPENYKNRLLAFLETKLADHSTLGAIEGEFEHLAARLDAVYVKASKGIHVSVSPQEARLAIIHTYLWIAEVARAYAGT